MSNMTISNASKMIKLYAWISTICDITYKDLSSTYENDLLGRVTHPYNVSTVANGLCLENDN